MPVFVLLVLSDVPSMIRLQMQIASSGLREKLPVESLDQWVNTLIYGIFLLLIYVSTQVRSIRLVKIFVTLAFIAGGVCILLGLSNLTVTLARLISH